MGEIIHSQIVGSVDGPPGDPFAMTVGMDAARLEAAWRVSSHSVSRKDQPAVAELQVVREYPGAPITGMSIADFDAYAAGDIALQELEGGDPAYIQYPGGRPLNLEWELVGSRPVERSQIFLVGKCATDGTVGRGTILLFDKHEWIAWLAGVMNGEFDPLEA